VDLNDDWSRPDDLAQRFNDAGCGLAMLVNPHAPSGRWESAERLAELAGAFRGVLLVDEAYVDFAQGDAVELVRGGPDNVLLLRSLSKGYSLAGLRFGYGLGSTGLIESLNKAKDSYNTDALAQAAASAALTHRDYARDNWRHVVEERHRLMHALRDRGFDAPHSQANFLLVRPPVGAPPASEMFESLKDSRIYVRYFDQDRLRDRLRITVGSPGENDRLIAAIDAAMGARR
jgi:histidinol-phosphate aminotransferase